MKIFMYLSLFLAFLGALLIGLTFYQISKHQLPATLEEFKQFVLGCSFFFTFIGAPGLITGIKSSAPTGKILNRILFGILCLLGLTMFFLLIFHL